MRNASEILRNAGGLGESISQNSLRVFLIFWRDLGGAGIPKNTNTRKRIYKMIIFGELFHDINYKGYKVGQGRVNEAAS